MKNEVYFSYLLSLVLFWCLSMSEPKQKGSSFDIQVLCSSKPLKNQVQMLHWWLKQDQECGNDMQMFAISKSWWYPVTFTSPSLLLFSQNVHVRVWLQRCWARSFSLCRFKGLFAKGCIPPTEPSLLSQPPHNHLCQKQLKKTKQQIC